ncbi:hypothetical protein B0A52_09010 [Exophiala mesophila]|uniref:AAA+ ATPase domain-containing protein n=1 Tax=Exophiala mesophila TaxID=212818 RepID=A0A438MVA4_EXOME|nr:hypothetical protein B0A52_09010 [Exophiala mesophila]
MAESQLHAHAEFLSLFGDSDCDSDCDSSQPTAELKSTPLFSGKVKAKVDEADDSANPVFPAYGLLGHCSAIVQHGHLKEMAVSRDSLIYANMQEPWSAFICGQQGAGKSYTMSCILENALIGGGPMGRNPYPMAGVVFHYDKFTSAHATQVCEAVYLSSSDIKVQVLVSPSNYQDMKRLYRNLPGYSREAPKPEVIPLLFSEKQLNVAHMKTLMAFDSSDANPPLYMSILNTILKDMAIKSGTTAGIDYMRLKAKMDAAGLSPGQMGPLELRYTLIESFLRETAPKSLRNYTIDFSPGTILIVDLSCPFVTEGDACALFSIFLSIFLNKRSEHGMIVALDEAHKFLTEVPQAKAFSEDLVQVIRQQRHLGTRVVVATQEPTISPKLLDLCNVSIVHQFGSPAWYSILVNHIAALGLLSRDSVQTRNKVLKMIVKLKRGEALVFCPKACLGFGTGDKIDEESASMNGKSTMNGTEAENESWADCQSRIGEESNGSSQSQIDWDEFSPLEDAFIRVKIRPKVTADGGKSIVASLGT